MSMLSDVDVKKYLGKEIVIEPFADELMTPVGYDFTVGDFVFSIESGLLEPTNGIYELQNKSTYQILTKESLWVSSKIGGTFHSKVSLVSKGLSHISTTLDPGWYGPLLITIRNNTQGLIEIKQGDPFVTLIFSQLKSPTNTPHFKPEFRKDILLSQMENQTKDYVKKISSLVGNNNVLAQFEERVRSANKPMSSKVLSSIKNAKWHIFLKYFFNILGYGTLASIVLLQFYWDKIKPFFNNIEYDSSVFSFQIPASIALLSLLISLNKK